MPELPEAETVIKGLSKYLTNQRIKNIRVLNKKSLIGASRQASKSRVVGLRRRGKSIIIDLDNDHSLLIHLKMTGQLIFIPKGTSRSVRRINLGHPTNDFVNSMPSNHTRIIFELTSGTLYFNDLRKFGWIKILPTKEIEKDSFVAKLGPEPLTKKFNPEYLTNILKRRPKSSIKAVLLNQSVVAGIGNIYTDEALFGAKILPYRKNNTLKPKEIKKLVSEIKKVLKLGIKHSGTSIQNYRDVKGAQGKMQNYLKVYGQANLPCKTCKQPIQKNKTAGRGTHFCLNCQK
ncbi:MAG: bifunctional DNA-formamidopyrimidine glycosylase/DNA-(apurinic or apyrimidinic site) lyase [Patescibacteria group bacterium]|nr:bifunctional DNA-formamidopyrimidine glycosylase/DNA-(apurinic or apyrimidinic site) lyase [Patescibacteria group bacterium]